MNAKKENTKKENTKKEDAKSKPEVKDSDADLPELVKMRREGRTLEVHPFLVDTHKKLGWSIE